MTVFFDREKVRAAVVQQVEAAQGQLANFKEEDHPAAFAAARVYSKVAEAVQLALTDEFNLETTAAGTVHAAAVVAAFMMQTLTGSYEMRGEQELGAIDYFVEDFAHVYAQMATNSEQAFRVDPEVGGTA